MTLLSSSLLFQAQSRARPRRPMRTVFMIRVPLKPFGVQEQV
jgi:hypothetical protein